MKALKAYKYIVLLHSEIIAGKSVTIHHVQDSIVIYFNRFE